jgi:hypothetical protein
VSGELPGMNNLQSADIGGMSSDIPAIPAVDSKPPLPPQPKKIDPHPGFDYSRVPEDKTVEQVELSKKTSGLNPLDNPVVPGTAGFEATSIADDVGIFDVAREQKARAAAQLSSDPERFMSMWETSKALAIQFPESTAEDIMANYDVYMTRFWGGVPVPSKTLPRAVLDNIKAGALSMGNGYLGFDQLLASLGGFLGDKVLEGHEFSSWAEQAKAADMYKIDQNNKRIDELMLDETSRSVMGQWLKDFGNQLPANTLLSISFLMGGLAGNLVKGSGQAAEASRMALQLQSVAKGAGTGINSMAQIGSMMATKGQVIQTMLASRAAGSIPFSAGMAMYSGTEYNKYKAMGVDDSIAIPSALVIGSMNQIIETSLGSEAMFAKVFSKTGVASVTDKFISRLTSSNAAMSAVAALSIRLAGTSLGEVAENTLQEVDSSLGQMFVKAASEALLEDGSIKDPLTMTQAAKNIAQAAWDALKFSPVMGVAPSVIGHIRNKKAVVNLMQVMPSMTKEAAVAAAMNIEFTPGLSEEAKKKAAETIYNTAIENEKAAQAKEEEIIKKKAAEAPAGTVERSKAGALNIEERTIARNDIEGGEDKEYYARSNTKKEGSAEMYGGIEVNVNDSKITLLSSNLREEREGLVHEILDEVMARNIGKEIELSDIAKHDPFLVAAVDRYKQTENIREPAGTMADESQRARLRAELYDTGIMSPGQVEAKLGLMQVQANAMKLEFAKYAEKLSIKKGTAEDIGGEQFAGVARFYDNGVEVSAETLKKMDNSIIYLAEGSNAAAATHELIHYGRVMMSLYSPETLKAIEDAYGITDKVWKPDHDERLARELMNYFVHGAANEKVKPFLDKMREVLGNLWRGALSKIDLNPEVEKTFKEWIGTEAVESAKEEVATKEPVAGSDVATTEPVKSKGHVMFFNRPDGTMAELYRDASGDFNTAPIGSVIDIDTKNRIGRFEARGWLENDIVKQFSPAQVTEFAKSNNITEQEARLPPTAIITVTESLTLEQQKIIEETIAPNAETGLHMNKDELVTKWADDPNFKEWFRDSVTKDKDGKPQVWYHGTSSASEDGSAFEVFDMYREEPGAHFGTKSQANEIASGAPAGGRMYEVFLRAENPLRLKDSGGFSGYELLNAIKEAGYPDIVRDVQYLRDKAKKADRSLTNRDLVQIGDRYTIGLLQAEGFDSIIYLNRREGIGNKSIDFLVGMDKKTDDEFRKAAPEARDSIIVFSSEQVKSIYNNGNFSDNNLSILHMSKDDLISKGEDINARASAEASSYSSVQEWVEKGLEYKYESLSADDKAWFQSRFDYIKSEKKAQYPNKGDFATFLKNPKNLSDFMHAISRAMQEGVMTTFDDSRRAKRIRDAISSNPELVKMVKETSDTGWLPSNPKKLERINAFIRSNEDTMKFLYAEVAGNTDLANEALSSMKEVPEVNKSELIQREGITLEDQKMILKQVQDDALRSKIMSGSATVNDILAYEKVLSDKGNKALTKVANLAVDTATRVTADRYNEKIALIKLKQAMQLQREYILSDPPHRIDNTSLKTLMLMKEYLRNGQQLDISSLKALSSIIFHEHPGYAEKIIGIIDEVGKKDFKDWTIDELKNLSDLMKVITDLGRSQYARDKFVYNDRVRQRRQTLIDQFKKSARYQKPPAPDSEEEKVVAKKNKWLNMGISAGRPDAVFDSYDKTHALSSMLSDSATRAKSNEYEHIERRTKDIKDFIREKKISKDIFRKIIIDGIGDNGDTVTMSASQLLGARALMGTRTEFNEHQRRRFIYGTFFSEDFKNGKYGEGMTPQEIRSEMEKQYPVKVDIMLAEFEKNIKPEEEQLVQMMIQEFNKFGEKSRFIHSMLSLSGKEMNMESYYFPLRSTTALVKGEDTITDSIISRNNFTQSMLEDGMIYDRQKNMSPINMRHVQYDIMELFFGGITRQEHLINTGDWAKSTKMIFNSNESAALEDAIKVVGGVELRDYINRYIDSVINPNGYKERGDGSEMLKTARGKVMTAMLSWRLSTMLVQAWTSPLITLAYAPKEFLGVVGNAYLSGNPHKWLLGIEERSAILKNRQLDPFLARLKQLEEQGVLKGAQKIGEKGFEILSAIDRFSVAIQWESVFRKEMKTSPAPNITPEEHVQYAKEQADKAVLQSQPTQEDMFRSPLYRNMDSFKGVILQFTQPLNVIWNNLRYDIPDAFAREDHSKWIMTVAAYALSGLGIGVIKAALGKGPQSTGDEDEDKKAWDAYYMTYFLSQYTDSIPIAGPLATSLVRSILTGKPQLQSTNAIPAIQESYDTINDLMILINNGSESTHKQVMNAVGDGLTTIGLLSGTPGLSAKELVNLTDSLIQSLRK